MECVKLERHKEIWKIILNQPEKDNKLNIQLMKELLFLFEEANQDLECRVVILSATGRCFCNGGALGDYREQSTIEIRRFGELFINLHMAIVKLSKPVIVEVQGDAHGGGLNLVEACDVAVASENARFSVPEMNSGIAPMMALTGLSKVLGRKNVMRMAYFSECISAKEAAGVGFVTYVCPENELQSRVNQIAQNLITKNPVALMTCKRLYYEADMLSYQRQLETGLNMLITLLKSKDACEGLTAQKEGRSPIWSGI